VFVDLLFEQDHDQTGEWQVYRIQIPAIWCTCIELRK